MCFCGLELNTNTAALTDETEVKYETHLVSVDLSRSILRGKQLGGSGKKSAATQSRSKFEGRESFLDGQLLLVV